MVKTKITPPPHEGCLAPLHTPLINDVGGHDLQKGHG
jgi:hypothetical protein